MPERFDVATWRSQAGTDKAMRLANLPTWRLVTVAPIDSLDAAISLMEEHNIHHLPVVDAGHVVGMLSDRDLLLAVGCRLTGTRKSDGDEDTWPGPKAVADVMSHPAITLPTDATVQLVARTMIDRRIGAVVLTSNHHPAGIVSRHDLLARVCELADVDPRLHAMNDRVSQHMRVHVFTISPRAPIHDAAALMHEKGIRHLPVATEGIVLGMLSDRDIRRACGVDRVEDEQAQEAGRFHVGPVAVHEIMSKRLRTIAPGASVLEAARRMTHERIGALPVVDEDMLVGIVAEADIIRMISHVED